VNRRSEKENKEVEMNVGDTHKAGNVGKKRSYGSQESSVKNKKQKFEILDKENRKGSSINTSIISNERSEMDESIPATISDVSKWSSILNQKMFNIAQTVE